MKRNFRLIVITFALLATLVVLFCSCRIRKTDSNRSQSHTQVDSASKKSEAAEKTDQTTIDTKEQNFKIEVEEWEFQPDSNMKVGKTPTKYRKTTYSSQTKEGTQKNDIRETLTRNEDTKIKKEDKKAEKKKSTSNTGASFGTAAIAFITATIVGPVVWLIMQAKKKLK